MTEVYKHFIAERPHAGVRRAPPRMTREQLEAATRGRFSAGQDAPGIIAQMCRDNAALDRIEARAAAGTSHVADRQDREALEKKVASDLRRLGLYPVAAP